MRIQHNVTALNAYRNLRGNNSSLAKNLEKLSSGYRINRAGDDAAGLAVSEKMRAQITGLEAATKNAQDGISLIQTAEGALTEVHSMLNRMASLATQSANGTYDNEVDRANLQKEVVSLKKEIDRISESSNYNGIKLLDGSMSNESLNRGAIKAQMNNSIGSADLDAVAGQQEVVAKATVAGGLKDGETLSMSFNYKDENGNDKVKTINLKADLTKKKLIDEDGNETALADNDGKVAAKEIHAAVKNVLAKDKELNKQFDIKVEDTKITFTAKKAGLSGATITGASQYVRNKDGALTAAAHDQLKVEGKKVAADAGVAYKFANAKVFGGGNGITDINKALFEVNGEKFLFASQDLTEAQWKQARESGAHIVTTNTATDKPLAPDVQEMARRISEVTGLQVQAGKEDNGAFTENTTDTDIRIQHSGKAVDRSLTLQIGDTADDFNKMKVSVQSTSAKNLKIADVDISTQAGAADAIGKIKNAINSVSSTRGDLGALQNRLDHTINNLGVMHENITEAESRIRDTDMAKEMMAYAKNNILVQSATAMLAQANQLPQGVLQLLQ